MTSSAGITAWIGRRVPPRALFGALYLICAGALRLLCGPVLARGARSRSPQMLMSKGPRCEMIVGQMPMSHTQTRMPSRVRRGMRDQRRRMVGVSASYGRSISVTRMASMTIGSRACPRWHTRNHHSIWDRHHHVWCQHTDRPASGQHQDTSGHAQHTKLHRRRGAARDVA